jgi:hypothetical protein
LKINRLRKKISIIPQKDINVLRKNSISNGDIAAKVVAVIAPTVLTKRPIRFEKNKVSVQLLIYYTTQLLNLKIMKTLKIFSAITFLILTSCSTVSVYSDYDKKVDFSAYKTYAFYKTGIDKVEISDLDKRRILNAIDQQMAAKGFTKSENPDLLINLFTKSREQVNVNQFNAGWGYGWGWGWNPYFMGGHQTSVSTSTQGSLYIDFVDAKKKEMIWQGEGTGTLTKDPNRKDERINEFVAKILNQYPPLKQ